MSYGLPTLISFLYLMVLFAIAYRGDQRAGLALRPTGGPWVYSLSLAVYCTSWTFFGSVGLASQRGIQFLPIYIGPTLMAALWPMVVGKMVRIGRAERITSIADFISSRYGKSHAVGALVTVIAIIGIVPYISLQLKAVSDTFHLLVGDPVSHSIGGHKAPVPFDTAFHVTLILTAFTILFGARRIDASEHHRGMVNAIAFESVVKLASFMAVGALVTYGFRDGAAELFAAAAADPEISRLFTVRGPGDWGGWLSLTVLSMMAIICLPRQFQVAVVENVDESHVRHATWQFPLYLILINLFVLPIALAGRLEFAGQAVDPDTYVLALPLARHSDTFAMIAFLGGLSAATGMVIVETIALATMFSNYIAMPLLVRSYMAARTRQDSLSGIVLAIRRLAIAGFLLLGYLYARLTGENFTLVGIGLMSFAAVAQFAPALLGGLFWRGGSKAGALAGMGGGFLVWAYTLFLPSLARSGVLPMSFTEKGLFGIDLLMPGALFGLGGMEAVPHALLWSMLTNVGLYVLVSLLAGQSAIERIQASLFVDSTAVPGGTSQFWRGNATISDLQALAARFVGAEHAEAAFDGFARSRRLNPSLDEANPELVEFTERLLAGAIGTATARVVVASVAKGDIVSLHEVMEILDENSQVIAYSHKLEQKSLELEATTAELRAAYEKLTELSRLKDEFIATVTHELRTPLTSIRSFSEILFDNPDVDVGQRQDFLGIIIKESERLTRLINQVLDLAKLENGTVSWDMARTELESTLADAASSVGQLFKDKGVALDVAMPPEPVWLVTDRDRFSQVVINLLSNAVKFCEPDSGRVVLTLTDAADGITITVADNGPGIPPEAHETVFEKFQQVGDTMTGKPAGTGLGLTICRNIVTHLGGRIWVDSRPGHGATFSFFLPRRTGG